MTKVGAGFLTLFAIGVCVIIARIVSTERQNQHRNKHGLPEKLPEKSVHNRPKMYLVVE